MVICPNCGSNTPEGRFCERCGAQLVAAQQPAYPPYIPQVSNVPTSVPELKSTQRSFYYSGLFYVVIILDLLISFCSGALGVYGFSIETSKTIPDLFGFSLALFLMVFFSINIILGIVILNNRSKSPHSIDINLCWIKSLLGCVGVITLISGLYFFIISIKMQSAYDAGQREKERN